MRPADSNGRPAPAPRPKVVALGGGHGLHASLSALRLMDVDVTAIVTVADDGGSSGRIRRELPVLPPGDLRMALAALATGSLGRGADSVPWSMVLQHRMGGVGVLAGHPIGNLLLTGLMELHGDAVSALRAVGDLVGARGTVLPMADRPLDLIAEVVSVDADDAVRTRQIRGQSAIASTAGRVTSIRVIPRDPPACAAAVSAIEHADVVILGPGSWFTSVIPHLLIPELAAALAATRADVVTILNLVPQAGETEGFSAEEHVRVLTAHCPQMKVSAVIADSAAVADHAGLREFTDGIGARLVIAPVADSTSVRHDPARLSRAVAEATRLACGGRVADDAIDNTSSSEGVR